MTAQEILQLIQYDADTFHLSAADALPAFAEILADLSGRISADDLTTLVAIGSVLNRETAARHSISPIVEAQNTFS